MPTIEQVELEQRLAAIADRAASGTGIELVEIQLRGAGKARLLRVYIDKPGGVTHGDCELISQRIGKLLDEEDAVPGESYTLEVSSPGVERKLAKARDFERVIGRKIRLVLLEPLEGATRFEGKLAAFCNETLDLETASGDLVHIPVERVKKANLKFDW